MTVICLKGLSELGKIIIVLASARSMDFCA